MKHDITKTKFFITGGGTGGHIYPAISVIDELIKKGADPEKIQYIGNKKNLEYKIAKDKGYNFLSTTVFGMPRKLTPKFFLWGLNLLYSAIKASFYFLKYKPDIVFATGGYVCAPVLFGAKLFNVPYVLHDSDCYPGIVTRSFAKGAFGVNLAFSEAKKYINSKNVYHFNNPVRSEFFEINKQEMKEKFNAKDKFLLLIMGGSQGAQSINEAALDLIKKYSSREDIKIILQTGKKNYQEIKDKLEIPKNTIIAPYFDNMAEPITAADLIVSRAGSISISEILSAKTPSILIPYPFAAKDHQRINARAISDKNAAIYVEDSSLKTGALFEAVESFMKDREKYKQYKENASNLGKDFNLATERITNLVLEAAK